MSSTSSTTSPNSIRHELTQCQHCYLSKTPGTTFFRCSGCRTEMYCSKACQKAAWPSHKTKCAINQRERAELTHDKDAALRALRAFTAKHRPTLCECALRALDLRRHPEHARECVFMVNVRARPLRRAAAESTTGPDSNMTAKPHRPERAFVVVHAAVVPLSTFHAQQAADMRAVHAQTDAANRAEGMDGTLFVVLNDIENGVANTAPAGFVKERTYAEPKPYMELLVKNLNGGVLL